VNNFETLIFTPNWYQNNHQKPSNPGLAGFEFIFGLRKSKFLKLMKLIP